jgi:hypothetical protein
VAGRVGTVVVGRGQAAPEAGAAAERRRGGSPASPYGRAQLILGVLLTLMVSAAAAAAVAVYLDSKRRSSEIPPRPF